VAPPLRPRGAGLPTTPTNKVLTRTLVHQKFRADRIGGDPVYVRGRGEDAYRSFGDGDEAALHEAFVAAVAAKPGTSEAAAVDLSLTDAEERFAAEARAWFTEHAETPPETEDLAKPSPGT